LGIAEAARDDPGPFRVILTRDADINLGLAERASVAKANRAFAFVSVHCNGSKDPTVQRSSAYIHERGSADSMRLADAVLGRVREVTGSPRRKVKRAAFGVLQPESHLPETAACLVEVSYITNPREDSRLASGDYRRRLANAILDGISDYLSATEPAEIQLESPSDLPGVPGTEDAAQVNLALSQ